MGELAILHFQMIIIFPMGARRSIYNPMDNKRQKEYLWQTTKPNGIWLLV